MIEYRIATSADTSVLVRLMHELGYSHTDDSILENLQCVQNHGGAVFVALWDGSIVGCVCAIIDVRLASGLCGEIASLIVFDGHRQKGIGKGLIKYAEKWLGCQTRSIRVRANVKRSVAHKFYEELGYEEEKSQKLFRKFV